MTQITDEDEQAIAKMLDPVDMTGVVTRSPMQEAWMMYRKNIPAMFGLVTLILILLVTLYGSFIYSVCGKVSLNKGLYRVSCCSCLFHGI